MSERRTIRRYAHEMYPHAEEGETRALAVEVPYLYAKAVGLNVWGTGWYDDKTDAGRDRPAAHRVPTRQAHPARAQLRGASMTPRIQHGDQAAPTRRHRPPVDRRLPEPEGRTMTRQPTPADAVRSDA